MNPREKLLAGLAAGALAVVALVYGYTQVAAAFSSREASIRKLKEEITGKERKLRVARRAAQRLNVYREMSLPEDVELAGSLYQSWLLNHLEKAGMSNIKISATTGRNRTKTMHQHSFTVTSQGNLAQLTSFLHQVYSVDHLHRIRQFRAQPIKGSKDLSVALMLDALSLQKADHEESLNDAPAERLQHGDLDEYLRVIVGRNIFAPANKAPRITSSSSQKGSPNSSLSFAVKASDPDTLDKVTYAIEAETLEGASIDPKSGQFRWTPKKNGEYQVTVIATDNGLPSKSDRQLVKLTVSDPPPPPPPPPKEPPKKTLDFDNAKYTYLTAITEVDGRSELWLTIRTTGEILKLHVGDKLDIGSIQGVVKRIKDNSAELEAEGKSLVVALGDPLLAGAKTATEN